MSRDTDAEDWDERDLDRLLERAWSSLSEALTCYQAGAPHAALASLAGAFEGILLAAVVAHPEESDAAGRTQRRPSRLHLPELAELARSRGWLDEQVTDQVLHVLNTVRIMSTHPGAYVRGMRQVPDEDYSLADPEGFATVYELVYRACIQVAQATALSAVPLSVALDDPV